MDYDTKTSTILVELIDEVENNNEQDEFTFYRNGLRIKLRRVRSISGTFFSHEVYPEIGESRISGI